MRKNIAANLAGRVITSGLRAVLLPAYLHVLGVETYGLIGVYLTLRNLLAILDFGIGATFIREVARLSGVAGSGRARRELLQTLEIVYWGIAVVAGVVIVAIAPFLAQHWLHPRHLSAAEVQQAIRVMGAATCFAFPLAFYQGGLFGLQRQALANVLSVSVGVFQDAGALVVILALPTIGAFVTWHVFSGMVAVALAALVLRRFIPPAPGTRRFSKEAFASSFRFGAAWFGYSSGSAVVSQADKVVVTHFVALDQFGYYTIAQSLAMFLLTLVGPVQMAAFPRLSQLVGAGDRRGVAEDYERASQYLSLLLFPAAAVLIAFAPAVLLVWTRKADVAARSAALLQIFVVGASCGAIVMMLTTVQGAYAWLRTMVATSLVTALAAFPLTYFGVTRFGTRGAAVVWSVLSAALLLTAPLAHRKLELGPVTRWLRVAVLPPAAISAVIAVAGRFATAALNPKSLFFVAALGAVWACCTAATGLVLPHVRIAVRDLVRGRS